LPGETIFTSSGTFTVPKKITKIDGFCVGGGGKGAPDVIMSGTYNGDYSYDYKTFGSGGGSGYTKTVKNISVTPGQQIAVTVGAGGTTWGKGTIAGTTSVNGTFQAVGGYSAVCYFSTFNGYYSTTVTDSSGGNGGSGGGMGGLGTYYYYAYGNPVSYVRYERNPQLGGKDGADAGVGSTQWFTSSNQQCKGQGTTTRYFGETDGTLYSTGGDAALAEGGYFANAKVNTGNGGSGIDKNGSGIFTDGYNGASGVAIIRWTV
jgi:hypothetical protein